jgi:hypothetical protein
LVALAWMRTKAGALSTLPSLTTSLQQVIAGLVGDEQRPRAVDADQFAAAAGRPFLERPQIRQAVAVRIAG